VRAIEEHVGSGLIDLVLSNGNYEGNLPGSTEWVRTESDLDEEYAIHTTDLVSLERPWRHDSGKLSRVLMDVLAERTGPLVE
jgi:hypothetical protein